MMLKINPITQKVELTQGDNASIRINIQYVDKKSYELKNGDSLTFTIRKNIDDKEAAVTKSSKTQTITFVPEDTKSLKSGVYVYDVQLTTSAGKIYTIIPTSFFEILKEVSR